VLDRASTFADGTIVRLLKTRFIPVAIDQAYQRRQKDTEGEFYRKIAGQGPRNNFQSTTQGLYVAAADGKLLGFSNNRGETRIRQLLRFALEKHVPAKVDGIESKKVDKRYRPKPPKGGAIVRVRAKILGGYQPTKDRWQNILQSALSRDNLWLTRDDITALGKGEVSRRLAERIARYHLVDNTRGEPPMWSRKEIRSSVMSLEKGTLRGKIRLATEDKSRGYDASVFGRVQVADGRLTQFDLVVKGSFWGEGTYTRRAPEGKFPLAIAFELADGSDVADAIPPQGSRGWVDGYLRSQ